MQWSTLTTAELCPEIDKVCCSKLLLFISLSVEVLGLFFSFTMTAGSGAPPHLSEITFLFSSKVCFRGYFSKDWTFPPVINTEKKPTSWRKEGLI